MSLSGSSASRNSIWAITRFASSSSMKVGRKMMRSLSSREKMSNARSPRGVCSITIGTSAVMYVSFPVHALARVLDMMGDLPHHQRVGNAEGMTGEERVDDLVLEGHPVLARLAALELRLQLRAQGREVVELAQRLREIVVEGGEHLFL